MSYFGTAINESPVLAGVAGAAMEKGAMLAVKFDADGALVLAGAGEAAVGILLADTEEAVGKGDRVTVQIKDMGLWVTGEVVKAGDLLAADAAGKAVAAPAGAFILAQAMEEAAAAGTPIRVQIVKAGYAAATT